MPAKMGGRSSAQLDDLARAVADGVPRRVVVGRIAAFMAAVLVGDPELALGAKKRCPKGRRRCGDICCKPGYVCQTRKHKKHCVCPKPHRVCNGRCVDPRTDEHNCGRCGHRCATGETCVKGTCTPAPQGQPEPQPQPGATDQPPAPTCSDGVRNGNETDVDCGGPSCPKCAEGRACALATDCASGVCSAGVCVTPPPACSADLCGAQHGCPPCANGKTCGAAADCASGHCAAGVCVQCAADGDCPAATAGSCQRAVCTGGACGFAADDTNVPTAATCMTGACSGGVPATQPAAPDTPCPAGVCDGSGHCVGCVSPDDCGTGTECTAYTCTSGTCGAVYTAYGTPTGSPTCSGSTLSTPVCDGSGNVTQSQTSCSPYVCQDATSCRTSCSSPSDCVATSTCSGGTCVPRQCTTNADCHVANGTGSCNQGICGGIAACDAGYADCDGIPANGCEVHVASDSQNCGACGNVCGPGETCVSGTCACAPGDSRSCYSGPPSTQGVGICHGGMQICTAQGTWGPCAGETLPQTEICGNGLDDDCDGRVDNGC